MSDDDANPVRADAYGEVFERIKAAIDDVPVGDATPAQVADALLALGLSVAETAAQPRATARVLMRLAEVYLAKAGGVAPPRAAAPPIVAGLAGTIEAAVAAARRDYSDTQIQGAFLGFAVQWLAKTGGPLAAAQQLYAFADELATGPRSLN